MKRGRATYARHRAVLPRTRDGLGLTGAGQPRTACPTTAVLGGAIRAATIHAGAPLRTQPRRGGNRAATGAAQRTTTTDYAPAIFGHAPGQPPADCPNPHLLVGGWRGNRARERWAQPGAAGQAHERHPACDGDVNTHTTLSRHTTIRQGPTQPPDTFGGNNVCAATCQDTVSSQEPERPPASL